MSDDSSINYDPQCFKVESLLSDDSVLMLKQRLRVLRGPALSMLFKLLAAPLVAAAWLIAARLVVDSVDTSGYAAYMLVAGLAALLPFTDLGLGAAVMDAFARRNASGAKDPVLVLVTTWRVLVLTGFTLAAVGGVLGLFQLWTLFLGLPPSQSSNLSIAFCVMLFGIGLPLSVGPRILSGLERNHWAVGFQALSAILMVFFVWFFTSVFGRVEAIVLSPYLGVVISNGVALACALKLAKVRFREVMKRMYGKGKAAGEVVRHVAGPMLVISTVLPMAYQFDRIVVSHFVDRSAVAEYSIAYQFFAPMLGVLGSAGVALWPVFARHRVGAGGLSRSSVATSELAFVVVGLAMGIVVLLGTPYISQLVAGDAIVVSWELRASFAGLLLVQAASYPLAMVLTDPGELRLQAMLHVGMLVINLPLSVFLAKAIGVSGPVLGSVASIVPVLLIPQVFRVLRITSPEGRSTRRVT